MVTTPNKDSNQLQEVYTLLSAFITRKQESFNRWTKKTWNSCTVLSEHHYCTLTNFNNLSTVTNIASLNAVIYYFHGLLLVLTGDSSTITSMSLCEKMGYHWVWLQEIGNSCMSVLANTRAWEQQE